jgi:glycosyltransferase involved in cell wall biosynthesis
MIYIKTQAFNARQTIVRAVESVLGQTYADFTYLLCDNGSTDGTGEIIRAYAAKDRRIRMCANRENYVWGADAATQEFLTIHDWMADEDYLCFLDADDEYSPSFLSDMLAFMDGKNLDTACCGSDFINAASQRVVGARMVKRDLILGSSGEFSSHFPYYFQFMRTYWGKLYKGKTLRSYPRGDDPRNPHYGYDTCISLNAFRSSQRVGILAKSLHKYYMFPKSVSRTFDNYRINDDRLLYARMTEYLLHFNGATPRNSEFTLAVYVAALKDTLKVLLNADISQTEKLNALRDMFLCEHARKLAAYERFGALLGAETQYSKQRRELFGSAAAWLLSREEIADGQVEGYCELGEFLGAAAEDSGCWIFFKKLLARFLVDQGRFDEAKPKLDELAELLPGDREVEGLRAAYPR